MAKRNSRNPKESRNPRNSRNQRGGGGDIIESGERLEFDESRFGKNSVSSLISFDTNISLNDRDLDRIKSKVKERMFEKGLNSSDSQTKKAVSYKRELFRYFTGKLYRSFTIKTGNGFVEIKLKRDRNILLSLEKRYGIYFRFSKSDLEFVDSIITKKANKLGMEKWFEAKIEY